MTHVRVKGFKIFTDRHGRQRCYHRATRTPVDLAEAPIGSAGFLAICSRIEALQKIVGPAGPGTLGLLIVEYRRSPMFRDLATRTRSDYQRVFDYLKPIGDTRLSASTNRWSCASATKLPRTTEGASATMSSRCCRCSLRGVRNGDSSSEIPPTGSATSGGRGLSRRPTVPGATRSGKPSCRRRQLICAHRWR